MLLRRSGMDSNQKKLTEFETAKSIWETVLIHIESGVPTDGLKTIAKQNIEDLDMWLFKEKHGCVSMSEARRLKIQKELNTGFNIKKEAKNENQS